MKHEFALFYKDLVESENLIITDQDVCHRIMHVLRKKEGDDLVLFNKDHHGVFTLKELNSKKIAGILKDFQKNQTYTPHIKLFLPVLKKEALSEAVYRAVECGVSEIQLVMTEKVQRKWQGTKELERLQRVVVAAAEQSKHFLVPNICEPISFSDALNNPGVEQLLCADPEGESVRKVVQGKSIGIFLGPEAGLTQKELDELKNSEAFFFKLTPTILRAQQAASLSVAFLRSL